MGSTIRGNQFSSFNDFFIVDIMIFERNLSVFTFLICVISPETPDSFPICCRPFYSFTLYIIRGIFFVGLGFRPLRRHGTMSSPYILTLCSFASLISPLSPVHSYGGGARPPPPHSYTLTRNEWHNHIWLILSSRYLAVGFHIANNAYAYNAFA